MTAKKSRNEKLIASIQALVSVGILVSALAGIQKNNETDIIPIYMFDERSIQNTTYTPFVKPQKASKKASEASLQTSPKEVFSEKFIPKNEAYEEPIYSKKTTEQKPVDAAAKSTGSRDTNDVSASQNAYSSNNSFSSFYSKADYHYEEAAKLTQKPKIISKGAFIYPQKAWDRDIEGIYKARLWVDINGNVVKTEVLDVDDTFGFASAIQKMAKTFKYEPVIVKGQPVPFTIIVPFEFSLN